VKYRFLFTLLLLRIGCLAQTDKTITAAWILPGVLYQPSSTVKLSGQFGYFDYQQIKAVYIQAFIKANKYIILNPGYLSLVIPHANEREVIEHTLMNAVIFTVPLNKLLLDDRNLVWNRFIADAEDLHFYRNRLRITWPFKLGTSDTKIYAFDEGTYFFNRSKWSRNRLAIGFGYDIVRWFNIDVCYVLQRDTFNGRLNLFFISKNLNNTEK
jgi:hypothetical protein